MEINWKTMWYLTFISLGLAAFFAVCSGMSTLLPYIMLSQIFWTLGGVLFVCLFVIRFDDVRDTLNDVYDVLDD